MGENTDLIGLLPASTDDEIWRILASNVARGAEYNSNEHTPFPHCVPAVREDFLETLETILSQDNQKFVWLFGDSGSGKSTMAYTIAYRLRIKNRLAATFFFSEQYPDRSSTDLVYLTIAYQIGLSHHRARDAIIKAIRLDPALLTLEKARHEQFKKLVVEPLKAVRHVWKTEKRVMIFDSLGEALTGGQGEQITALVHSLAELLGDPSIPISDILITSRPVSHVESLTRRPGIVNTITPLGFQRFYDNHDIKISLYESSLEIQTARVVELVYAQARPPSPIFRWLNDRDLPSEGRGTDNAGHSRSYRTVSESSYTHHSSFSSTHGSVGILQRPRSAPTPRSNRPVSLGPINTMHRSDNLANGLMDPVLRNAIKDLTVGELLYKYTGRTIGRGHRKKRHPRFFWVNPLTRTLYWSSSVPGSPNVSASSAKSAYIEDVRSVPDSNPVLPGLHQYSIVVTAPKRREIKFTAPTKARHDIWLSVLQHLLARTNPAVISGADNSTADIDDLAFIYSMRR